MQNTIYPELFKIPSEKFLNHLDLANNERILFSGKFGKGKTTFLKYFFDERKKTESEQEYFTIHISPVNYSVASNEDIFKYIKFDIILEILRKGIVFEESDFNFIDTLPLFIRKHPEKIIGKLLSFIPVVGKEIDKLFEKGKKLYEELKEHNDKLNQQGDGNELEVYIEKLEEEEGSIYENDFITKIIEKAIEKIAKDGKKAVLIVDDLDRLDPEHIFRILNVFASQFNTYNATTKANKFNLNKIIIVCDLDNIRNIYKNRYGSNVDFNGYVDKFYSTEPFSFNNYNELREVVYKTLQNIRLKGTGGVHSFTNYISHKSANSIGAIELAKNLVFFDFISLRGLLIFTKSKVFELDSNHQLGEAFIENDNSPVIIEAQIINSLLGGYESSIYIFEKLAQIQPKGNNCELYYKNILYVLTCPKNGYISNSETFLNHLFDGKDLRFKIINGRIENLELYSNTMYILFNPTISDYLNALKLLFKRMYTNGIIE